MRPDQPERARLHDGPAMGRGATIARMHVYLQQTDAGNEAPRFLRLSLQPDLFGGWELLRESGRSGTRSQLRRELYLHEQEARQAFDKARDAELHRGLAILSSST